MERKNIAKGIAAGLLSGIAATYVMTKFQSTAKEYQHYLKQHLSFTEKKEQENNNGGSNEEPSTVKTAETISETILNKGLTDEEKPKAGQLVHYSFGTLIGGLYGALSEEYPIVNKGAGAPFGAAVWMAADNIGVPALGLSKSPLKYPVSMNAYALGSHLIYGMSMEMLRKIFRKIF